VIARDPTPTRVAGRVTQLMTSRDQLIIPKLNYTGATDDSNGDLYTSGIRTTWTGEIPSSSSAMRVTDPIWGQLSIPIYTAMLSIPITNNMVEDASFPIVSYISGKFAEAVDLLRDYSILKGTGQGQPAGILNNIDGDVNLANPVSIKTGSASAITALGLVALGMALPEQYDDNACYVMNKTNTGSTLAQLQDQNDRFIWGSGLQDSGLSPGFKQRMLLGYPVIFSGFMPDQASNSYPVLFGDLSAYYLVNRIGFSVQVLRELYAETNQILILGRIRFGGTVAEPWKLRVNKCST
jgi:HK97 family phage major capsid protein